jgi:hypothetical protein
MILRISSGQQSFFMQGYDAAYVQRALLTLERHVSASQSIRLQRLRRGDVRTISAKLNKRATSPA